MSKHIPLPPEFAPDGISYKAAAEALFSSADVELLYDLLFGYDYKIEATMDRLHREALTRAEQNDVPNYDEVQHLRSKQARAEVLIDRINDAFLAKSKKEQS